MHKKLILIIFLILIINACQDSDTQAVEGVLSKSDMIKALTELHLLEASINHENTTNRIKNKYNDIHFRELFERLEITKATFDSSLMFYKKDLKLFKEIYDSIYHNLEVMKIDLEETKLKLEAVENDSII